eukprot:Cvel_23560.t2-p1 / transcript=Cvel_23560.t2 / gene=Cvel_23560 / organism=Chromera_velia_CCMP2878 / gene_product=Dehydrogenase/reductase SDR family member 12, putative / transcript_product=Dehydrogenase/reductase SDR family member 12, putative / location=Cvel_scaffold2441:25932-27503(+) / protein_length=524 / sequence_SO=supercontig / SO=protein_coding / is_pseudo=false
MWQGITTTQFFLYGKSECTRTGWEKAVKKYPKPDLLDSELDLKGKKFLCTGANGGIGKEVTTFLAKKGADVFMVCRSKQKGEESKKEIEEQTGAPSLHLLVADVSLEEDVRSMWAEFEKHPVHKGGAPRLHGLICNAGALLNELTLTKENVETTFACHLLFGTYLLTKLALPTLESTPDSRVVVVSSGGMYNTKFPEWNVVTCRKGPYDGQLAYARAKRGQVLLCEEWTKKHPKVKFVSCHPGWTSTDGVDKAYGAKKSYLEPLRTLWQGSEGIVWLCVVPSDQLEGGGFYLDRTPRRKHLGGAFFTEGSFTKNSESEVAEMMERLERWSSKETRPDVSWSIQADQTGLDKPLLPLETSVDLSKFAGRWHVWANIPTSFDKGTANNIEDYTYTASKDGQPAQMDINFSYVSPNKKEPTVIKQIAKIANDASTKWNLSLQYGIRVPVPIPYLIVYVDEAYEEAIIGVPDRSYLWVMGRCLRKNAKEGRLQALLDEAERLGYDVKKAVQPAELEGVKTPEPPVAQK